MIRRLSDDLQHALRSGVAITSAGQCVEELLLNSSDAGATCVAVRVDLEALRVQVVDNGSGLAEADMDAVGTRHFTSKCHSVKDLEDLRFHGFRGEAIASIVDVSGVVEITSKHRDAQKTLTKLFRNGRPLHAREADVQRPSAGTTVTVCSLFYNLPVRRKRVDCVLEFERIRRRVEATALAHPRVSYSLKNDALHSVALQLPKACDVRSRFCQIFGLPRGEKLREIRHAWNGFHMQGFISCEGHSSKCMQYLYVNERLVLGTRLHKLVDSLMRQESVVCRAGHAWSGKLHAIYVLNIQCGYREYDVCFEPAKTLIEFRDWESVAGGVGDAVRGFLRRESLFSEPREADAAELCEWPPAAHESPILANRSLEIFCPTDNRHSSNLTSNPVRRRSEEPREQFGHQSECCHSSVPSLIENPEGSGGATYPSLIDNPEGSGGAMCPSLIENPEGSGGATCPSLIENPEGSGGATCPSLIDNPEGSGGATSSSVLEIPEGSGGATCPSLIKNPEGSGGATYPLVTAECDPLDAAKGPVMNTRASADCCPAHGSDAPRGVRRLPEANRWRTLFRRPGPVSAEEIFGRRPDAEVMMTARCDPRRDTTSPTNVSQTVGLAPRTGSLKQFRRLYGRAQSPSWTDRRESKESGSRIFGGRLQTPAGSRVEGAVVSDVDGSCQTAHLKRDVSGPRETRRSLTAKLSRKRTEAGDSGARETPSRGQAPPSGHGGVGNELVDQIRGTQQGPGPNSVCGPGTAVSVSSSVSSDWLHCYEASLGKNVFVNKSTGLSSYHGPRREMKTVCRTGPTSAAASVASTGVSLRHEEVSLRHEYVSLRSAFTQWENPVFERRPLVGVNVSRGHSDAVAVKIHNILHPYRFTKQMIHSMEVLQQVDGKFIACLMSTGEESGFAGGNLLVLVDQHAAHERVRLEQLIADSYEALSEHSGEKRLKVAVVEPPLELDVTDEQHRLFRAFASHFRKLGLCLRFPDAGVQRVLVTEVPLCFLEKEATETQRRRSPVARKMVESVSVGSLSLTEKMPSWAVSGRGGGGTDP
ncbi:DNA mismatch repair protein Mlh3 isoform X2 [Spea bombifrons]|uniref:DNA mismatch repair protein Mlh3 isoform X2 n=1 Tax=Spea bombifrons TaxID=233779 RepID=UPI00234ACA55|nr:DNA mismatch repair protein Mlh3 isoform X2 [Spea bombifrons]